ncbi:MAG: 50S ribosomal protein L21 [Candidatus Zixiibacteriota bacterium]|nr:MAG: 50S ribosomal protein L21 [candidate division Zixibacteria bacterium]
MYAVFEISGHQFNAEEGATITVPSKVGSAGEKIDISDILLVKKDDTTLIGTPTIEGAKIEAEVLSAGLDDTVLVYKFKRRTKYRRIRGHRQNITEIKINKIVTP